MRLSVIVTSYNSPLALERCLESLVGQPEAAEIIVADCSPNDFTPALARRFPQIRFVHFTEKRSVPELRWAAFGQTSGDLVATVEARCATAPDWCARLAAAHREHPETPSIGGPVAVAEESSTLDCGVYFCEYGLYAPPLEEGPSRDLTGANLSFKRAALLEARDLLEGGKWETLLHERWRKQGRWPRLSAATVTFWNGMPFQVAVRQRFWYGRGYAAERVADSSFARRLAFAAGAPGLPLVLTWRLWTATRKKRLAKKFIRALGWILLFQTAWALGEFTGYLAGRPRHTHIY